MKANGQLIENLNRSETFQNYARAYTEAVGLPLALRPVATWQLSLQGKRKENAFCALMAAQSHACVACLQLQAELTRDATNEPATRTCAYGLCETAVPVKLGVLTIGFLQTGQVMRRKPTAASYRRAIAHARKLGVDINNKPVRQAYFNTPVASAQKLKAVTNLLVVFADHLAMRSNQFAVQSANVNPPNVVRAKLYINEHFAEPLSLGRVSNAVNSSHHYFCKQFRKSTGLCFTEFVSRTRVEKARNLLLNPNLRVSEIGFAVGFRSLSHFNRMFKRIAGQSPTQERNELPAVGAS